MIGFTGMLSRKNLGFILFLVLWIVPNSAFSQTTYYPATGIYNGFLNQINILECDNNNTTSLNGYLKLYSQAGLVQNETPFFIEGNGSVHIILNDLSSIRDSYGTFEIEVRDDPALGDRLSCRTVFYKPSPAGAEKDYDFSYVIPVQNSGQGVTGGIFNSVDPAGTGLAVNNWLSVVNTSSEVFRGEVVVYDPSGQEQSRISLGNLAQRGRIDIPLGHPNGEVGGIFRIIPENTSQQYQAFMIRYGVHTSPGRHSFAFPLKALSGNCQGSTLHASTMGSAFTQNWLELANIEAFPLDLQVDIRDRFGVLLDSVPVSVPSMQQFHLYLNQVIDPAGQGNVGSVEVRCDDPNSRIMVQSVYYGSQGAPSLSWAYGVQSQTGMLAKGGSQLSFPINTFLGMGNWIKLAEESKQNSVLDFGLFDSQGLLQASGEEGISASGTNDFDVHSKIPANIVGSAVFSSNNNSDLSGHVLRTLPDKNGAIGSIVYIPAGIQTKNSTPAGFIGNPQSLDRYKDNLSDEEIAHFATRIAFGATVAEKTRARSRGLNRTVSELLALPLNPSLDTFIPNPNEPDWNMPKVAWLRHMIESPNPLHERMALIFHDLFATSCKAADDQYNCKVHIELLRRNALGNFRTLAQEISTDYVMLQWLNGSRNSVEAPDENFSREFWELFTLGEASRHEGTYRLYNSQDIVESSRAFTGWRVWINGPRTVGFDQRRFDSGEKVIWAGTPFEARGNFNHSDIINLTLDSRPESARWIVKRLFSALVHDHPEVGIVNQLADQLVASNWEIRPIVKTLLSSEAFFSEEARNARVKDAATYLIGFLRSTGIPYTPQRFQWHFSHQFTGYEPAYPLSVNGWPLNKHKGALKTSYFLSWLTGYANLTNIHLNDLPGEFPEYDVLNLIPQSRTQPTGERVVDELASLLAVELSEAERSLLIDYTSTDRRYDGTEVLLDLKAKPEALKTKVRGLLWLLSQHRDYLTF